MTLALTITPLSLPPFQFFCLVSYIFKWVERIAISDSVGQDVRRECVTYSEYLFHISTWKTTFGKRGPFKKKKKKSNLEGDQKNPQFATFTMGKSYFFSTRGAIWLKCSAFCMCWGHNCMHINTQWHTAIC